MGKRTPPCLKERLYWLLYNLTEALTETHTEYVLAEGTLLGALRHGDLIPNEDDVDMHVGVPEEGGDWVDKKDQWHAHMQRVCDVLKSKGGGGRFDCRVYHSREETGA